MPISRRGAARVDALGLHLVEDRQEVRRGHHDHPRLEVHDQLHLARGHAAGDRDDGAPQPLGAVVRAEPAGEQPVAVGDVHQVAGTAAGGVDGARHHLGPDLEVVVRVAHDGRLARRTGGRVHAADLAPRDGEHAEGVVLPQVLLGGEREPRQVGQRAQVGRGHAGRVERAAVVRDVLRRPARASRAGARAASARSCSGVVSGIRNSRLVEPVGTISPPPSAPGRTASRGSPCCGPRTARRRCPRTAP